MKMDMKTAQSAYTVTQADSQQSLSAGLSASTATKAGQRGAQSARQQKTPTVTYTRSSQKPSTDTKATAQEEMELLAGMFNDLKRKFKTAGLLTVKRSASTHEMVLVITPRLEVLMRGENE